MGRMVGLADLGGASASPVSHTEMVNAEPCSKTAAIVAFPKIKLPPLCDVSRECARLIWSTFPAASQRAVCQRAARETGAGSADTFHRIISGETKRPDFYVMQCVQIVAASRGVAIPPALAVRVSA